MSTKNPKPSIRLATCGEISSGPHGVIGLYFGTRALMKYYDLAWW